jgi:uncharacterized protein YggT (Ycf19 family)
MYVIKALDVLVSFYVVMIAVRAFMTWIRPEVLYAYRKFFLIIEKAVDPLLDFVKRVFPAGVGRVDLSPVIAIVLVETAKLMLQYGIRMFMKNIAG